MIMKINQLKNSYFFYPRLYMRINQIKIYKHYIMNFFKGLLGIKNDLDSTLQKTTFEGTLYKVIDSGRSVIFKLCKISIVHDKKENTYNFKFVQPESNEVFEFPIYADMKPVTFNMTSHGEHHVCFEWILDQSEDHIGCYINPDKKQSFKDLLCRVLKILYNNQNQQYLSLCQQLTGIPIYKTNQNISNISKSSKGVSHIKQATINQILVKEALMDQNILVQTASLYEIHENGKLLMQDPIIFILRGNQNFEYEWVALNDTGSSILEQKITQSINYDVDIDQSYLRWFHPSQQGNGKVYEINFGKQDIAISVKFAIIQACYQMIAKKKIREALDQQQYQYIKKINQENIYNNFQKTQKIIKVYEKNQPQIDADDDKFKLFYADEEVKKGLQKYRTFCQGKCQDFEIVSLGESLELMKITEDNEVKIQGKIKLLDKEAQQFVADKILLNDNDTKTIMKSDKGHIYYQDIETEKVIQQWAPSRKGINYICYESKIPKNQLFRAISTNTIYQLDPRVAEGVVTQKSYTTPINFCQIQSVAQNRIVTGSEDGVIRLYNQVGNNSHCKFSSFGQPVRHLQSTKDGNFVLATFRTKLILLPTLTQDGISLYQQKIKISQRPRPVQLKIKLQHLKMCKVAQYQLTPAKFDQSSDSSEKYIVSGFGQYLAIWNFSDIIYKNDLSYKFIKINGTALQADFKYNNIKKLMAMTKDGIQIIQTRYNTKQITK